ncbi:hypothetical protein MMC25_007892 [Agyrium rufum]|nr:hypothetical protein [Agyrium rufum]
MKLSLLLTFSTLVVAGSTSYLAVQQQPLLGTQECNCSGTNKTIGEEVFYVCGDKRLGPAILPSRLPLLSFVSNYDRFGGLAPAAFLDKWFNSTKGSYRYPDADGFQVNTANEPIKGHMMLEVGAKVDRFGYETGKFVSAADAPYAQRSLPPSSLNIRWDPSNPKDASDHPWSYHVYTVKRQFKVVGGPIAPWFGQPGLGAQFYVGEGGRSIKTLIADGYLERVNMTRIKTGPGKGNRCG